MTSYDTSVFSTQRCKNNKTLQPNYKQNKSAQFGGGLVGEAQTSASQNFLAAFPGRQQISPTRSKFIGI